MLRHNGVGSAFAGYIVDRATVAASAASATAAVRNSRSKSFLSGPGRG